MLIGYARVSTRLQETHLQLDALRKVGVKRIFQEKSSSVGSRPMLQTCIKSLTPGDLLVVYKLDRVARSVKDLLSILERVLGAGAQIRSLTEPIDTTTPLGMFLLQILGCVAQLERSITRERVIAGQISAIERGVKLGRPLGLSADGVALALQLSRAGFRKTEIGLMLGVSRYTIDRVICQDSTPNHHKYGPHRPVLGPLCNVVK